MQRLRRAAVADEEDEEARRITPRRGCSALEQAPLCVWKDDSQAGPGAGSQVFENGTSLMRGLLTDRDWLAGKGGASSCGGQTIYIDPEGYNYARYVAFAALDLPEGKSRDELRKEARERELEALAAKLAERIATPPTVPDDHGLRFFWNGIKQDGKLYKLSYSMGKPLGIKNVSYPEERLPSTRKRRITPKSGKRGRIGAAAGTSGGASTCESNQRGV